MKKWKSFSEWVSIIATIYYVTVRFYDSSCFEFSFFSLPRKLTVSLPIVIATGIRYIPFLWDELKKTDNRRRYYLELLLKVLCVIPFIYTAFHFDYGHIAYLAILPFCLYKVDINRILKAFLITIGGLLLSTTLLSLSGVVENISVVGTGDRYVGNLCGAYGIISSTDFAAYFVFLLLAIWCVQKKRDWRSISLFLILVLIVTFGIWKYTGSHTSTFLCGLFIVAIIYERIENNKLIGNKKTDWIPLLVGHVASWSFPLLALAFYGLTWMYGHGNTFAIRLNSLMNNRLLLAWTSYLKYGVHPFGAITPQNGNGGGLIHNWQGSYEFIDSSYALLLIRYGWIITLIISVLWVWMTRRAIMKHHRRIALAMMIIAVHCLSEHHFIEVNYNVLLITSLCGMSGGDEKEKKYGSYKNAFAPLMYGAGIGCVCFLFLPKTLSRLRAVFYSLDLIGGNDRSAIALIFILILIGLLILFGSSLLRSLYQIITKKKKSKLAFSCLILSTILLFTIHIWNNSIISAIDITEQITADTPAVNCVISSAKEPVYASQKEELYKRQFDGFADRIDTPEMIARNRQGTVISDIETESQVLFQTGAVYTEISGFSGLYTYDEAVITALEKAGYKFHSYYCSERSLNFDVISEMNRLVGNAKDGIKLPAHTDISEQPDISLFNGNYTARFELKLDTSNPSEEICDIEIRTYYGSNLIAKRIINAESFDDTGKLSETIDFTIKNNESGLGCAGVTFNVHSFFPIKIESITYRNNPEYDTRKKYDQYNRLVSEKFFDANGNPIAQSDGQYGMEYIYESGKNLWSICRYLDQYGVVTTGKSGYAQIVRTYNNKEQMIGEQYLDEKGEICLNSSGYSSYRRFYNDDGIVNRYCFYGTNGLPVNIINGYAEIKMTFNPIHQKIREEYYGADGKPILLANGYAAVECMYDAAGNMNGCKYFGIDWKPTIHKDGYYELRRCFDELGRVIREEYYGLDGEPTLHKDGYWAIEFEYDTLGNMVKEHYFDLDGKPV